VNVLLLTLASCASGTPLAYVSLGDSLAVGVGSSDPQERGYAPLYRDLLQEEKGHGVKLIQLGVAGETSESFTYGSDSQLSRAEETLKANPGAYVTLSLGGNDLLAVASSTDAEREAAISRYAENLDYILRTLVNASGPAPKITILTLYNPAPGSFTDQWAGRLNESIREVAGREGVSVAGGDEAFQGHEDEYAHYARYPWDIHPTDEGYEALARTLAGATEKT
jgi:lysophospholipase L1-like esterase